MEVKETIAQYIKQRCRHCAISEARRDNDNDCIMLFIYNNITQKELGEITESQLQQKLYYDEQICGEIQKVIEQLGKTIIMVMIDDEYTEIINGAPIKLDIADPQFFNLLDAGLSKI